MTRLNLPKMPLLLQLQEDFISFNNKNLTTSLINTTKGLLVRLKIAWRLTERLNMNNIILAQVLNAGD
jgi:hypothetical protein